VKNYEDPHVRFIYSITEDMDGFFWLGTGNGIKRFNKKTGEFIHYYHVPADTSSISDGTARTVFADSKGYIWVGYGSKGTDKFNSRNVHFIHYKYNAGDSTSISSNVVNCFFEDAKKNLWLGTLSGGLCHLSYKTGKFSTLTDKNGLPGNTIYSILNDNHGHFWFGTDNGLSQFDPLSKTFTNYDYKDGLQGNNFATGEGGEDLSWGACCKASDGTLYFGGNNGFNFFNPSHLTSNRYLAPVVITRFKLFDSLVKGANESNKIALNYDQNYFSFEFSSLSFYNPDKNLYAYKLEGVDKNWIYSGSRHYVGYTNIDPGTYVFKVKGTNNDGVWNEEGTSITIIINPPWWRTWWAYTIYGLLLAAAIFAFDRMQKQRIIRREIQKAQMRELEHAKEIENAYYELRATQAQLIQQEKMASLGELTAGIAHEIQNPLNFVNNFSEVNKELIEELKNERSKNKSERDEQLENELLNDIAENELKINHHGRRADEIVKGMLQHSRTSTGKKEPTDINAIADEYFRLAYHGLRAKDQSFNATTKTDFDNTIGKINVVPQDIARVILNLINNAFYSVDEKKKNNPSGYEPIVSVTTKKEKDKIEIRVKDNGNGIPQEALDKIFQPFFTTKPTGKGTGLGLSLSYDIVKAHGGMLRVETKENEGCEFTILLPMA
jgi:signal transduction histidine kinase